MKAEKRFRELKIERKAIDEESRTVELAFSSEEPYERSFGIEVLDHADGSADRCSKSKLVRTYSATCKIKLPGELIELKPRTLLLRFG